MARRTFGHPAPAHHPREQAFGRAGCSLDKLYAHRRSQFRRKPSLAALRRGLPSLFVGERSAPDDAQGVRFLGGASMRLLGQHLDLLTHTNWLRQLATPTQTQEILQ